MKRESGIIVIGGSQGGLKALEAILPALPAAFPLPVVAVLHRMPLEEDRLVPLLQRICLLPVVEAEDKTQIEAGKVAIAPADYHLLVENGAFVLSIDESVQYSRPSIDVLFESAADAYGEGVTAVLLTGANEDGARGMAAVKKAGGVTIAQDPETAEAPKMPQAAIDAGAADRVLSLQEIVEFLAALASSSDVKTLSRKV
ncbi:MAG: chemotaxis protein CheB [Kiritimatiellae bacterium]|nr:chemotaxis protein CheB [Kiritimatiellia bacterium]